MFERCMCGAIDCPSCGSAQGSVRCRRHSKYACENCEEELEETGEWPEPDEPFDYYEDDDL